MKVRQSASLVAGVCTLCVTASTSVTPVPAFAAATPKTTSPVVRPVELTAASDALVEGVNVAGSVRALPNLLYSQLVGGTLTEASATTNSVKPQVKSAAVTQADTGSAVVDAINVASLPLQNGITVLNALAGAAGGSAGNGGNGAGSLQALPNLLYSQLVAGTLTEASATTAINAALATEQTALTNLAATPGKIVAADVLAVQKLAGDFGANSLSVTKFQTNTLALTNTDVTPSVTPKSKAADSAKPGRHAARTNDNNPVSSAIKAIKQASNGSYVGKHRADAIGVKAAAGNGQDGSKGSSGK